jgi:hypothetical protein
MFSAQLVPSPVDRETEVQVVMRRSMAPSRSRRANQSDDDDPTAHKRTHISENNGLSTGGKRATLRKGEVAIGITDPDLEGFLPKAVITDEEYICEI